MGDAHCSAGSPLSSTVHRWNRHTIHARDWSAVMTLSRLIFLAGIGQLSTLIASALVPVRLNWRREFSALPRLHRQMYWVYGAYIVMTIATLGLLSILTAQDLASGTPLAR